MLLGRIAPATGIVWESIIWRAKICGSNKNGARTAPSWVINTLDLKTSPTAHAIVEKCTAQSCCVCPISLAV